MNKLQLCFCLLLLTSPTLFAQKDSLILEELPNISVTATRLDKESPDAPLALTKITTSQIENGQQLSANDFLGNVPGLFALNPDNFAQDLRVSIRGFGARSAFGIRGVKLIVDGLPESTPDGQAQVDNLDLGIMQNAEIIRGPSSGLYGNASGGVISMETKNSASLLEAKLAAGSYGFQRYQLTSSKRIGNFNYLVNTAYTQSNGYRDQSAMKNMIASGKFSYNLPTDDRHRFSLILNYVNSPQADDPGGIDSLSAVENRKQARDRNILFKTGETVQQGKAGLTYVFQHSKNHQIRARTYYTIRDFANKLPFEFGGIVELDRYFAGGGASYIFNQHIAKRPYRLQVGFDLENQADDRLRFRNLEGEKGDLTLDQRESFFSFGAFVVQDYAIAKPLDLTLALRYDAFRAAADDRFVSNGDDSGEINLTQFSPMLGLLYNFAKDNSLYGNISTGFETPTLSEFSANPTGAGGFNPDLQAQKSVNYELGIKGLASDFFEYELALFHIDINNELLPYELADFPGRTFYNNAGRSTRNGIETAALFDITDDLFFSATYTFSAFKFKDFISDGNDFGGKITPGIPKHFGSTTLGYKFREFNAQVQLRHIGKLYANNSNTVQDKGYTVANLRLNYSKRFNDFSLSPFLGVNNLFNTIYNSNIRINAFGGRYYEPAAELHVYGGVKIKFK